MLAFIFVLWSVLITQIQAHKTLSLVDKYKEGICKDSSGSIYAVDETWYDDTNCKAVSCEQKDGFYYKSVLSCDKIILPVVDDPAIECHMTKSEGHYPECCVHPTCSKKVT